MKTLPVFAFAAALLCAPGWVPTAAASPSTSCTASLDEPCTFHCNFGEYLHVQASTWSYGPATVVNAVCGGTWATCTTWGGTCEGQSGSFVTSEADGTCDVHTSSPSYLGASATCWSEPPVVGPLDDVGYEDLGFTWGTGEKQVPEAGGDSIATPPVWTPDVSTSPSPAVTVPLCTQPVCLNSIVVPGVETPPVVVSCETTGGIVCVDIPSKPIFPGATLPGLCSTPAPCEESITVLEAGFVPGRNVPPTLILGSIVILEETPQVGGQRVGASVTFTPESLALPQVGSSTYGPYGPYTVPEAGSVTLCGPGCTVPALYGNGEIVVWAHADETEVAIPLLV